MRARRHRGDIGTVAKEYSARINDDDVGHPVEHTELRDRRASSAGADDNETNISGVLFYYFERIDDAGEDDDGGPVLVIMHDGYRKLALEAVFDFEAAGGRDIFEVDTAEARRERLDDANNLLGILRGEYERDAVYVGKRFENKRLARAAR